MSDLLGIGSSETTKEAPRWISLDRHTGKLPTYRDHRTVYWKAPLRVEEIDLLQDGELLVVEQAQMLIRSMKNQNQRSDLAYAQSELAILYNRLTLLAAKELEDAGELADIQAKVEQAARELRAQSAEQEVMERRAADLQAEHLHLMSLLEQAMKEGA